MTLVETLYYQAYNRALLGNLAEAKMYLAFLREEYSKNESQFEELKSDGRWNHLVGLGDAIDNNRLTPDLQNIEIQKVDIQSKPVKDTQCDNQVELVKAICLSSDDLGRCLKGKADFHCSCVELETRFGRVDLVARDSDTVYPIEVKKSGAYHDCVGQVRKYILHFKLGLINKVYRNVIGVVIANSFDEYVLNDLHNYGAVAVRYKFQNGKIEFISI